MTSSSEDLARLFDAQYADFTEDLPMWLELARRHGGPVLELGCGTGRVLLYLARAGHEMFGLEQNPAMLERARARLDPDSSSPITFLETDFKDFSIEQRFPLAIAPLNVLAELSDNDFTRVLSRVSDHLMPQGVLAMDLPSPAEVIPNAEADGEPLDVFQEPESGNSIQVSALQRHLPGSDAMAVTWHYDELLPDGMVSRHRFETTFHLRTPETLRSLLADSGYADVCLYGNYEFGAFGTSSKRMIAIATAREIPNRPGGNP